MDYFVCPKCKEKTEIPASWRHPKSVNDPRSKAWKAGKRPPGLPAPLVHGPTKEEEQADRAGQSVLFDDHPSLTSGERNR